MLTVRYSFLVAMREIHINIRGEMTDGGCAKGKKRWKLRGGAHVNGGNFGKLRFGCSDVVCAVLYVILCNTVSMLMLNV